MEHEDQGLYFHLLKKFRTPLIADKKKNKWDKYKDMYQMLCKFKGCTTVLISVRGLIVQTTLTNKVTAEYVNFYFWGLVVKARNDLRDMDHDDDLICMRMSTNYYEGTITVGGVFEESDFMIFVTQNTPHNVKRPIYNLRKLLVQGTAPCTFPVDQEDPVPAMKKALAEMAERTQEPSLSAYERKKIAFLSAADDMSRVSDKFSSHSLAPTTEAAHSKGGRGGTMTMSFMTVKDESMSLAGKSKSKMSAASSYSSSIISFASDGAKTRATKCSTDGSKPVSRQLANLREKKFNILRKEKYDWIKIDKDDPMVPPETAPLYERTTSEESVAEEDDDIGYWRKLPDKTFTIFAADGTVVQDEVTIGFKPCSGEQFPPRKWINKKAKKEMVFKRKQTPPQERGQPPTQ